MRASSRRKQMFKSICLGLNLKPKVLSQDVRTHWSSIYCMLRLSFLSICNCLIQGHGITNVNSY